MSSTSIARIVEEKVGCKLLTLITCEVGLAALKTKRVGKPRPWQNVTTPEHILSDDPDDSGCVSVSRCPAQEEIEWDVFCGFVLEVRFAVCFRDVFRGMFQGSVLPKSNLPLQTHIILAMASG